MMQAFEFWFGPYPFYEDSFKIVEVPYLGMEHQSSITYGNKYMKGYLGRDLSRTGWGLKFDYIIIHEAGHEWFANNITYKDIADMWVHESFTTYSENLYLDYHYGKEASSDYVIGTRFSISNKSPMIGPYGVNRRGSDIYTKGANVLHTLRQIANDDEKWRMILRGLNKKFYHQTVESKQIEDYISETGQDLKGSIRIIADSASHVLNILAAFRKKYPNVKVILRSGNSEEVEKALRSFNAEIGIMPNLSNKFDIGMKFIGSSNIIAFGQPDYLKPHKPILKMIDVKRLPIIFREKGSTTRQIIEEEAKKQGVQLRPIIEVEGREACLLYTSDAADE